MFSNLLSHKILKYAGFCGLISTVAVNPFSNLDAVNLPKMLILSGFTFGILLLLVTQYKVLYKINNRFLSFTVFLFIIWQLIALNFNKAPFEQQFFGSYGRNTGFLTYFCFSLIFLAISFSNINVNRNIITNSAIFVFTISSIYGFLQYLNFDIIKWHNPYSKVIGFVGNPDFESALLGFLSSVVLAQIFRNDLKPRLRILGISLLLVTYFTIYSSGSRQGLVVSVLVLGATIFIYLQYVIKNRTIKNGILVGYMFISSLSILGMLQKGPFEKYLYKSSLSTRGDYWESSLNMIAHRPFFGVGLDSFGDWYRTFRPVTAALKYEGEDITNASHNVYLDLAATSGIIALVAFLILQFYTALVCYKYLKIKKVFDPIFVGILVGWIGYLAQAFISINNIGLGVWGWIFPAFLIAYARSFSDINDQEKLKVKTSKLSDFSNYRIAVGVLIGTIIALPPVVSDMFFRKAIENGNPQLIYDAANKWPTNTTRLNNTAKLFRNNKAEQVALNLAELSIKHDEQNYDAWRYIYTSNLASSAEKKTALNNMKKIDPNDLIL